MHTCTVRLTLSDDRRDEALRVLRSLVGPVRSQPGCVQTQLMADVQSHHVVTWVSRWRTRPDLERHLRSTHFRRILAVMELAAENPYVEFEAGGELRGLDLVHEVIGGAADPRSPQPTELDPSIPT